MSLICLFIIIITLDGGMCTFDKNIRITKRKNSYINFNIA